ncbi:unnamed protein product [Ilex paraguariensis]|uniref:S-adenosylmethionine-dependent methyltransferase n=1 Tax=Ilex paraguariensis TaxID=185542 RepID=A0ABC8U9W3_9AQUA
MRSTPRTPNTREALNVAKEMISDAIVENLDIKSLTATSRTIRIVDLGCSHPLKGNTIPRAYHLISLNSKWFNDHVSNDFNTLFASLPPDRKYFVAGVPGSFYEQLFPSSSLRVVHSSYALHWLSKVPEQLLDKNSPSWNKGRIHYAGASDDVVSAYAAQFEKDFEIFLNVKSKEITGGGMMILIVPGLPEDIHHAKLPTGILFNFLGSSLVEMVNAGIVSEPQLDLFNLPISIYAPSPKEMTKLVEKKWCFSIEKMEVTDPRLKIDGPINLQALIMQPKSRHGRSFCPTLWT